MNLSNYKITYNVILRTALAKIDANKQGFVVIVDAGNTVKGVLTDGDVRRAIIRGHTAEEKIEGIYTKNPKTVFMTEGFEAVIDFFKSQAIKFLPIVDEERKLVNLITKNQLHTLLLQDVHADLTYDFSKLDISVIDHEIFQRPWGYYKTTVLNDYFQAKIICVKPGGQLSLINLFYRYPAATPFSSLLDASTD